MTCCNKRVETAPPPPPNVSETWNKLHFLPKEKSKFATMPFIFIPISCEEEKKKKKKHFVHVTE